MNFNMKKFSNILIIIFFLFNLPYNLYPKPLNKWGFKTGISVSNQNMKYKSIEIDRDFDNYIGLNFDAFMNIFDYKIFEVVSQISYSQKGCIERIIPTYCDPINNNYFEGKALNFKNKIDYVSFFILGKLNSDLKILNPYIILGPRIDFLINTESTSIPKQIYNDLKKYNWGLSIGVGTEFNLLIPYKMLVEIQYSPDFQKIYETQFLNIEKTSYEIKFGIIF